MPDSRDAAIQLAINETKSLDLPLLEHALDLYLRESWELFNLVKPTLTKKEVNEKRNALYQLELLFLAINKCRQRHSCL